MTILRVVFLWDDVREECEVSMPYSVTMAQLWGGIRERLEVEYQGIVDILDVKSIPFKVVKLEKIA